MPVSVAIPATWPKWKGRAQEERLRGRQNSSSFRVKRTYTLSSSADGDAVRKLIKCRPDNRARCATSARYEKPRSFSMAYPGSGRTGAESAYVVSFTFRASA